MRHTWLPRCAAQSSAAPAREVERRLRRRDVTLRAVSKDGAARLVFASTLGLLRETVRRHQLAARPRGHRPLLELVGTHLSFANILAALQAGEERVAARFTADEATVVAEALAIGECRCYVRGECNADVDGPPFPLKVERALYGQRRYFTSVTAAQLDAMVPRDGVELDDSDGVRTARIGLEDVPREKLLEYFRHNISLHGYNFFRQSEGSTPVLWCSTHMNNSRIQDALDYSKNNSKAEDGSFTTNVEADMRLDAALEHSGLSYGVFLQPLLAGHELESGIKHVQQVLLRASIATPDVFRELTHRALHNGFLCQDTIALLTGDYEGAHTIASDARQFTQDPTLAVPIIENIRRKLGINDFRLSLDTATVVRNGLDYFCRCSKQNFLRSVMSIPKDDLTCLMKENSFRCVFCAKEHSLLPEDWHSVLQGRTD